MKTLKLLLGLLIIAFTMSCSKDDNEAPITSEELTINARMDEMSDDVSKIVEDQYEIQRNTSGSMELPASMLPSCATVTIVVANNTWTRTIDFGTTGCTMPNGNVLKGKLIASGSINFSQPSHTINYSFENFYHNNVLIQGNRTVVRTITATPTLATPHPVATMDINMSATFPNGTVVTRVGTRIREFIEGFNTPQNWTDNIFSITGSWTTTFPQGTRSSVILEPLRVRMNCPHIVRGVIQVTRNNGNIALIDFGNGTCDNLATLTINGTTIVITLGN